MDTLQSLLFPTYQSKALLGSRQKKRKYGSLFIILPEVIRKDVTDWVLENIPDFHLTPKGRELRPHVTVKFGFETTPIQELKDFLRHHGPFVVTLGDLFTFPEGEDGIPLCLTVEGQILVGLNRQVSRAFPCHDTYPTYVPHLCLAYLSKKVANHYATGMTPFWGRQFIVNELEWSGPDGESEIIPLSPTFFQDRKAVWEYQTKTQGPTPPVVRKPPRPPQEAPRAVSPKPSPPPMTPPARATPPPVQPQQPAAPPAPPRVPEPTRTETPSPAPATPLSSEEREPAAPEPHPNPAAIPSHPEERQPQTQEERQPIEQLRDGLSRMNINPADLREDQVQYLARTFNLSEQEVRQATTQAEQAATVQEPIPVQELPAQEKPVEKPREKVGNIVQRIKDDVSKVKFSDNAVRAEGAPTGPRDYDRIEEIMTRDEQDEMEEELTRIRDESIDEMVYREYIDEGEVARDADYGPGATRIEVIDLVNEHQPDLLAERELERSTTYGPDAVNEYIAQLEEMAGEEGLSPDLANALRRYRSLVEDGLMDAVSEARDQLRMDLEESYSSRDDRREYLEQFYYDHEEEDRFGGGYVNVEDVDLDTWVRESDGDYVCRFETPGGITYEAMVVYDPRTRFEGEAVPDLEFRNVSEGGTFGITGSGEAFAVFAKVVPILVAFVQRMGEPVMTFSAAEKSRMKLYDRLARTVVSVVPGYTAVAANKAYQRFYVIMKTELKERVLEMIKERSPDLAVEELV